MKLTNKATEAIKGSKRLRNRLALDLDKHYQTIDRWIDSNEPNGPLTSYLALEIIRTESGLLDQEILEDSDVKEHESTN